MLTLPHARRSLIYQVGVGGANRRASRVASVAVAAFVLVTSVANASRRAVEPEAGAVSMAHAPVVEIGQETRPVLSRARRWVLKLNERLRLPEGTLEVPVTLPSDLGGAGVKVELNLSLRDPDKAKDIKHFADSKRIRLDRRSVFVAPGATVPAFQVAVPPALVGESALITLVARELPRETVVAENVGPWPVRIGDRLEFGFGVESAAWDDDFPPARFRVVGVADGLEPLVLFDRRIDPARDSRDQRWHDASIGLDALAGKNVLFRFEAESLAGSQDVTVPRSLPVFANPLLRIARTGDRKRPNIILISLDTLRAASVSAYGYRHPTTPGLDERVARAGAVVRHAVVPAPFTPPSHMTMLTGLHPCAHGVQNRDGILAPEDLLLAEILRADGYDTAAFTENAYVVAGAGFARGFDTYVEKREDAAASPGFGVETFGAAAQWLEGRAHEPFFLFVHTYQVHKPYTPPRGYRHLFGSFPDDDERKQRWKDDQQAYDQEIRYADDLLGQFLDVLDARGLADDTIVVVTSDHGEEFGHHRWGGHGFGLYEDAILVPMIFRAPGLIEPGTVVDPQVGLVDLVPTLADLAGVSLPADVQGQSFAPLLRGEGAGAFAERPLVSRAVGFHIVSVRTSELKFIRTGEAPDFQGELFLLDSDPGELRPVDKADYEKGLAIVREALVQDERECKAYRDAHPVTGGKDSLFEHRPDWLINRNEIQKKLRSLGYAE